ncbi:hypothetical protein AXF42_Ash008298 [Apostasia shenzhenica]|uniref:Uncharacterized protein n=1 Tax=Apostasia shenzhenica TaxID=1088818 RepID=A0A2I0AXH5_9ASPA|nr:hypothetical protein AXF42_Ash008298 [Apostasia shenzhenica]
MATAQQTCADQPSIATERSGYGWATVIGLPKLRDGTETSSFAGSFSAWRPFTLPPLNRLYGTLSKSEIMKDFRSSW